MDAEAAAASARLVAEKLAIKDIVRLTGLDTPTVRRLRQHGADTAESNHGEDAGVMASAGQNDPADNGTREAAVREIGEDAVRALEVDVVRANADRLSVGTFVVMRIPTVSILEGLGCEPGSPASTRRGNNGLSVWARGRLDQAVAWTNGRIIDREPATGAAGEVSVRVEVSPAVQQVRGTDVAVGGHVDSTPRRRRGARAEQPTTARLPARTHERLT